MVKARRGAGRPGVTKSPEAVRVRFLFVHRGDARSGQTIALHAHPFWQLELVLRGKARAVAGSDAQLLGREQGVLVPPGIAHGVAYQSDNTVYLALKFAVDGLAAPARALWLEPSSPVWWFRPALERLLPLGSEPGHRDQPALEHLIAAMLCAVLKPAVDATPVDDLAARAARACDDADGTPTVAALARALELSPSRLHARFTAELGLTAKAWLDRRRAQAAARMLASSDLAIGDVAGAMRFADVFAFSRFFARVMGASPRAYRRAARVAADA